MRREGTTKDWDEKDHYKEAFELTMEQDVYKFIWAEKKGHKNKCIIEEPDLLLIFLIFCNLKMKQI